MPEIRSRKRVVTTKKEEGAGERPKTTGEARNGPASGCDWFGWLSVLVGCVVGIYIGYQNSAYMHTLMENRLWFSHIKEVEREISFRTEAGLYYSYYKQMIKAPSISQGLYELMKDNSTENWRTINVLERFNIYQEVFLAIAYRLFAFKYYLRPIQFYVDSVFGLHGVYVVALYCTAWSLSGTWLAGILAALFYIYNKEDTTRVSYTMALRESFALPFIYIQIAFLTFYLKPKCFSVIKERVLIAFIGLSSFFVVLTWQFAQFVFLLQAMALFGCALMDMVPICKVRAIFLVQAGSLLAVCAFQFFQTMILGSLVLSFLLAAFIVFYLKETLSNRKSFLTHLISLILYVAVVFLLTYLINKSIKFFIHIEADEHIYKFLLAKFGLAETKDFDANLYICVGAFDFLPLNTFKRLVVVFPCYVVIILILLTILAISVVNNWQNGDGWFPRHNLLGDRPELVYHLVQTVFFACMAVCVLRFKFLWTPHLCIMAAAGLGDLRTHKFILQKLNISAISFFAHIMSGGVILAILGLFLYLVLPGIYEELGNLKEFYDPDTVELMNWINKATPPSAVLSGSMQLLAGIKLCTGRKLTNHPHYEDKQLREVTRKVYQFYGRLSVEEVYRLHKEVGTDYIVLEDSICYSRISPVECRLTSLMDNLNGHATSAASGKIRHQRFCDIARRGSPDFTRYFRSVFTNKTFRVYQVM